MSVSIKPNRSTVMRKGVENTLTSFRGKYRFHACAVSLWRPVYGGRAPHFSLKRAHDSLESSVFQPIPEFWVFGERSDRSEC